MTQILIVFPTKEDKIENIVTSREAGETFVKEMLMTLDRIDCEKDVEVYVDSDNKDNFIKDYKALDELMDQRVGLYSLETSLKILLSHGAFKMLNCEVQDSCIKITLVQNFLAADKIFEKKNKDRVLNENDFRHCENHPDYRKEKSPLMGGAKGFENAKKWLPSAIGDRNSGRRILLNIDRDNNSFIIRYEDEHFNNQYHAYHLVKRVDNDYVVDTGKLQLLRDSRKNLRRVLKLINYRNSKEVDL